MIHTSIWFLCMATLSLVMTESAVAAEPRAYWTVRLIGADGAAPLTVYHEGEAAIQVDASVVADEESGTAIILEPGFFRRVSMDLVSRSTARVVAVVREWPSVVRCPDLGTCGIDDRVVLEPRRLATVRATLTSVDGRPIPDDEYDLRIGLAAALSSIRGRDAAASKALLNSSLSHRVTIRHATTAAELKTLLMARAYDALSRRDYSAALSLYQRSSDPDDPTVLDGMSRALVALKRFREAATVLERHPTIRGVSGGASPVLTQLAMVYFALDEDQKAEEVLRRHLPAAAIPETVSILRAAGIRARTR
jgi:hypothetical protein